MVILNKAKQYWCFFLGKGRKRYKRKQWSLL